MGAMLALGAVSVLSYLSTQPEEQLSDLTLANIEAIGFESPESVVKIPCRYTGDEYDHCIFIVITTDGKSKLEGLDGFVNEIL